MFMSKGNTFFFILLAILLTANSLLGSHQATRVYQVGIVSRGGSDRPSIRGLFDGLKDHGYALGENIHLHLPRVTTADEIRVVAKNLVAKRVDTIVAVGVVEATLVKDTTREIPIIFAPATNPLEAGLVHSLARPGTNLTGLTYSRDLEARQKELEVFKEVVPSLRRVAIFYDARSVNPLHRSLVTVTRSIATKLGLETAEVPIQSVNQIRGNLLDRFAAPKDGIFTICTAMFTRDGRTPEIARDRKLPLHGCPNQAVKLGALVAYAPDMYQIGRRAAWYVIESLRESNQQICQ